MIKVIRNERGIALVTALLLTLLALAIVAAVLYLVTQGIQVSSASKKYRNSLEASYGGAELFTKELMSQIYTQSASANQLVSSFSNINLSFGAYSSCVKHKMTTPTSQWSMGASSVCGPNANKFDPNTGAKQYPDVMFTLKGTTAQTNYKAYAQIVDTVQGNSDRSGVDNLDAATGVTGSGSGISPIHVPAVYTIEVQGEKETNPLEKAKLSVLYAY